jgi:HTH-type transcriptional regulator/antitoxin HigA
VSTTIFNSTLDMDTYRELLSSALPHVIRTEEDNERYIAQLEALHDRGELTPEEREILELLTLLIEDFENKHYQFDRTATPIEIVRELMDTQGLKQIDMIDILGTASVVSEVLSGRRELSKTHIQNLSRRFHVSPRCFFLRKTSYS